MRHHSNTQAAPSLTAPLLAVPDVERWLGVCGRTVRSFVQRGELPAIRLGRSLRFDPSDVVAFVAKAKSANR